MLVYFDTIDFYFDTIDLVENYMVVNELRKSTWRIAILNNYLIYISRK
jgi:hypothetical protein